MSPEAWTFFTLQSGALITLLGKALDDRKKQKQILHNTNGPITQLTKDMGVVKDSVLGLVTRVDRLEGKEPAHE